MSAECVPINKGGIPVPDLLPVCIQIVKDWEIRYKTEFKRITCISDLEFILRWHEKDKHLEELRTRYINIGYHEKAKALFEPLHSYVCKYNLVLDCLERYKDGKYHLRLRYPSGEPAAYFEHQEATLKL